MAGATRFGGLDARDDLRAGCCWNLSSGRYAQHPRSTRSRHEGHDLGLDPRPAKGEGQRRSSGHPVRAVAKRPPCRATVNEGCRSALSGTEALVSWWDPSSGPGQRVRSGGAA